MKTPKCTCDSLGCQVEVPQGFYEKGLCFDHYLDEATEKLDLATLSFRNGEGIDYETLDWLLVQVDFVVETMGDETLSLEDDQQSKLLQLILGIANFNEHV